MKANKRIISLLLMSSMLFSNTMYFNSWIYANSNEILNSNNESNDYYDVMVLLKDKASFKEAKMEAQKFKTSDSDELKEKKAVIGELKETALESQEDLINMLEVEKKNGNVKEFQSYYIVNSVHVVAKKSVIDRIAKLEEVEKIEKNDKIYSEKPIEIPTFFSAFRNIPNDEIEWNIKRVGADKVWDKYKINGNGVTVGILDSAVDMNHVALKNSFKGYNKNDNSFTYEGNYIDCVNEGNESPDKDTNVEHGSHCVGIMMGEEKTENGPINRIGVAPGAKWINARVFGNNGESSVSGFLKAAEWMLAPGNDASKAPSIINNSWGGGRNTEVWFENSVNAWKNAGILPVFASGNMAYGEPEPGPGSISAPANYKSSFAVGAVDKYDKLAFFSKRGPSPTISDKNVIKPEVSAPGVSIRSSVRGGYKYMSGTSMAAPHVSGVAALLKSANNNLTVDQMRKILQDTAEGKTDENFKKTPNFGYGSGIVNAYSAVSEVIGNGNGTVSGLVFENASENIPLGAEVFVKETNIKVNSDSTTGKYILKHPAGDFTLVFNKYGYKSKEIPVKIGKNTTIDENVNLEKKSISDINLKVVDSNKKNVEGAYVRVLDDSNIDIVKTDSNGDGILKKVPYGNYTVRIFKDGYEVKEQTVEVNEKVLNLGEIVINDNTNYIEKELSHDNNKKNTYADQNFPIGSNGYAGAAVRFVPDKIGGTITKASIYFHDRSYGYYGNKAKLKIVQYDERGRTVELLKAIEFDFEPGKLKTIPLESYQIKTDKPYYVVVQHSNRNEQGFLIGVDKTASRENSYIFSDNNLVNFSSLVSSEENFTFGGLMIRSSMSYKSDSKDIEYNIEKPILKDVRPEDNHISGNAKPGQKVQIVIAGDIYYDDTADEKGLFKITLSKKLNPGDEISCYAKNIDGIKSKPVKKIVLNDTSKIREVLAISKGSLKNDPKYDELRNIINEVENKLNEISEYERGEEIKSSEVREYQRIIQDYIKSLKAAVIALSPEKKVVKEEIDRVKLLMSKTRMSGNGRDVPHTKKWVKPQEWYVLNNRLLDAIIVYEKAGASEKEINDVIKRLKNAVKIFESQLKSGLKKVLIINPTKYDDGDYEGEGRGYSHLASHVLIKLKEGKITNIEVKAWNESEESLNAIKKDNFLQRIMDENSLDILPTNGYETECDAIVKAITQALQKALKSGESSDIDTDLLLNKIEQVKSELKRYKYSKNGITYEDGTKIKANDKWVDYVVVLDLNKAIKNAENEYRNKNITIDSMNKQITLLEIAYRNLLSSVKTGPSENDLSKNKYKDGDYEIAKKGFSLISDNIFVVKIRNGVIHDILIKKWADTPSYKNRILPLIDALKGRTDADVDVISEATISSVSIREAVKEALSKASIENNDNDKDDTEKIDKEAIEKKKKDISKKILEAKKVLYSLSVKNRNNAEWKHNNKKIEYIRGIKKFSSSVSKEGLSIKDLEKIEKGIDELIKNFKPFN